MFVRAATGGLGPAEVAHAWRATRRRGSDDLLAHQACCEHWAQGPSSREPRLVGLARRSRKCLACYTATGER